MPENQPHPAECPQATPEGSPDLPSTFEPAFRAVQELFQARLREARSRIDKMTDGWDELDKNYTDARSGYAKRMQRLFVSTGLLRPTDAPRMDRSGLLDLLDRIGTPAARAMATDMRLEDEWERRGEKADVELGSPDDETIWTVDEQILNAEGVFEPEARRQMLSERREVRAKTEKRNSLRSRITTEMRRMILFSMRERDFKELDELFKKRKYYLVTSATKSESASKKDRRGSSPQGGALRLAEGSGRIMALLAEMGTVRSGPEEFKKEAARRMCADVEEVISRMDAICAETAAIR
jgi:hypothetical protein